ncbi:MAG: transcription termination/antitermination protein NusA [Clostridia bacterium]|nr:transcription termination/antitermination protein NusA [Clostridia bacterium]
MSKSNKEFFAALALMEQEKGISAEYLAEKIENAIVTAVKKEYGGREIVFCDIDMEKQKMKVYVRKEVVEEVEDSYSQLTLEQARIHRKNAVVGGHIDIVLDTKNFGRIMAQTCKHVIRQGIKEAEKGQTLADFQSRNRELVTATVERIDPKTGNATINIGRGEAILLKSEQVPDEVLHEGDHVKVYVVDVKDSEKGPKAIISRTHPGLVKRLFEMEVPEIFDGTIEIKAVSRQAGSKSKLAVYSANEEIDAVGACIGQRGVRVNKIVEELAGEKIEIVKYSEDPVAFVSEALSPAKVVSVEILSEEPKACRATVPDSQLSLAIGNKGQNVRLAARLTGWKIDIRPESGYYGEDEEE